MPIKKSDRIVSYGMTGSGKSELARALWITMAPWRICIDVKDEHAERLPGIPTVSSPFEVREHPTVRAVPEDPSDESWYDALYLTAFTEGDVIVWLDEANEVTHPNKIPRSIRRYVLQGRARRCGHIACTPRPADVHPTFLAQAGHVCVFTLEHPRDRKAIADVTGLAPARLDSMFDELDDYEFIYWEPGTEPIIMASWGDPDELTAKIARRPFGTASGLPSLTSRVT